MKPCNDSSGRDKKLHLALSAAISTALSGISLLLPLSTWGAAVFVFLLTMSVGIAKEIYDSRQQGNHFCCWDLLFDCLGALVGTSMAWLIKLC